MAREKVKAAQEAKREFWRQHIQRWRATATFFKIVVAFFEKKFSNVETVSRKPSWVASSISNLKGQDERCAPLILPILPAVWVDKR